MDKQQEQQEWEQEYMLLKNRLSECDEQEARHLINSFNRQITFAQKKKGDRQEVYSYWKTPYPYLGISVGILVPVTGFLLLLLLP